MPNYYEQLQVSPTASEAEIQLAFDEQYEQWRRLVTHHDPNVVNQANQAIQLLEKIRATLSDPTKRGDYDEAIGIKGITAGLADPSVLLTPPTIHMTPPPPTKPDAAIGATSSVVNAWVCPNCAVANVIGTRFCSNCGTALGRDCPNCGKTIQATARFCPECGMNVEEATRAEEERRHLAELADANWESNTLRVAEQEPALHSQVWVLFIEGPFDDTMDAISRVLNGDLAGYRFFARHATKAKGAIRASDTSGVNRMNPLQLQVYVEMKEAPRRRVFVRLFGNEFFGDKTKKLFEDKLVGQLRLAVTVLEVKRL